MRAPSLALVMLLVTAVGCAPPNPDFCCVTPQTCAAAGLVDELRPCDVGQACKSYGCVAAECTTSGDCTSPDSPTCLHGLCTAGCSIDDDCAGIAGRPRCDATDATCVGCTSNDQCPAAGAICDAETRACRGCTADDQCASGVCIEATGICGADSAIFFAAYPESVFRYNTIVNVSPIVSDESAIWCQEGANITSNIIAYNSTSPLRCTARYSLFDAAGVQEANEE
jgi:hypothetical protein